MDTYLVNGDEVTWSELIRMAKELNDSFGFDGAFTTSGAAHILRAHGMTVERAPKVTP